MFRFASEDYDECGEGGGRIFIEGWVLMLMVLKLISGFLFLVIGLAHGFNVL